MLSNNSRCDRDSEEVDEGSGDAAAAAPSEDRLNGGMPPAAAAAAAEGYAVDSSVGLALALDPSNPAAARLPAPVAEVAANASAVLPGRNENLGDTACSRGDEESEPR